MDEKVNLRQAKKELSATGVERVDVQENKWQYSLKDGFFEGWLVTSMKYYCLGAQMGLKETVAPHCQEQPV